MHLFIYMKNIENLLCTQQLCELLSRLSVLHPAPWPWCSLFGIDVSPKRHYSPRSLLMGATFNRGEIISCLQHMLKIDGLLSGALAGSHFLWTLQRNFWKHQVMRLIRFFFSFLFFISKKTLIKIPLVLFKSKTKIIQKTFKKRNDDFRQNKD